jgi:16S rRNA (cytidine1402-2'-O)-methyltransferase
VAETGALVVVATPIGNLDDISPRAAAALRDADLVACEDTRRTAVLLRHVGSHAPMLLTHEHNEAGRAADLVARIRDGARVALVSDAGMPAISDPGVRVVAAVVAAGLPVSVVPGPSAVDAALVASGLPTEPYAFVGFFPRGGAARRELIGRFADWPGSLVGFESPKRLAGLLAELAAVQPGRAAAVCRELTKLHEEVVRGTLADLAARFVDAPRGEVTVVIGPGEARVVDAEAIARVLVDAGLGAAGAADVAVALGLAPRNAVYSAAVTAAKRSAT